MLTAEYAAAQAAVAGQISNYATLKMRLVQMASGNPAKGDTPKLLANDLQKYVKMVNDPIYLTLLSTNGGTPAIPGRLEAAPTPRIPGLYDRIVAECPPKVSVTIQQTIVPDPERTYALKAQQNVFYNDALTFNTDANGFLTNGAPTSASQVTAIASAIANDAGLFLPVTNPAAALAAAPVPAFAVNHRLPKPKPPCATGVVSGLNEQIAALACSDAAGAAGIAWQILPDLTTPGALQNLPGAALPLTVYASVEDLPSPGQSPPAAFKAILGAIKSNYGLTLVLKCSEREPDPTTRPTGVPENAPTKDSLGHPVIPGVYDGLVVSASRACVFNATQTRPSIPQPVVVAHTYLWTQDSRYLTLLPTKRGFLVARSVGYTFANGQATGAVDNRPSEALAVVSFPGTVVGSFFSGVTAAFTNRQTFTNGQTGNLTAQTNYLTAQTNYLAAQAALQTAKSTSPPN